MTFAEPRPLLDTIRRTRVWCATLVMLAAVAGCNAEPREGQKDAAGQEKLPWEGVRLQLVVAEDGGLAEAIGRLRGEWRGSTGAELEVRATSEDDLLAAEALDADAVICPAADLGELVQRQWLAPLPSSVSTSDDLSASEVFEADKTHDACWGSTSYAVSFGSPVFVCMYRADLLKKLDRQPPQSWQEYQELAVLLNDAEQLGLAGDAAGWSGAREPLGSGWAGLTLLARAASDAKHHNHYSALFDIETMTPLIASPPFVRALDELVAASRLSPNAQPLDPAAVRESFLQGRSGMAISWLAPRASQQPTGQGEAGGQVALEIGFTELPGGSDVYNPKTRHWEQRRESRHVPLLGISGRIGCVSAKSTHHDAAWQLLAWLSGPKWSDRVAAESAAVTVYRRSQLNASEQWVDVSIGGPAALEYAEVVERSLNADEGLSAPRIPGRRRYLEALDQAVAQAVRDETTSQAALDAAAAAWAEITAELGLERQRTAYRRSLGLR
ncbi:MAG TPA: extracellular solute-binding protein [Pirellulales bacterium]|nr:extracellular solute-binding protein [Pirellulales bacterium]